MKIPLTPELSAALAAYRRARRILSAKKTGSGRSTAAPRQSGDAREEFGACATLGDGGVRLLHSRACVEWKE
jgi:hypothetical protein